MSRDLFLVAFLTCCTSVTSLSSLAQPASESVSLGQTATLPCTVSGSQDTIYWYQQRDGQTPRYVHRAGGSRGEGIPDRFTASVSGNIGTLTILNVQREDEGVYYCGMWYDSSSWKYVFGGGTTLFVTGGSPVPPNVHLYPPSPEEIESKGKATFVCLIDGFSPPGITVTWQADSNTISSGVETTKPTKVNEKYVSSSYLTLDPSVWKSSNHVTCKVTHERNDYEKSVSHAKCP